MQPVEYVVEYVDFSLIPTLTPLPTSPTPTPSPTYHPVVGWIQQNPILVGIFLMMVLLFLMMKGIGFPRELIGNYVTRIKESYSQAKTAMTQQVATTPN